jgi:hypothetical protein
MPPDENDATDKRLKILESDAISKRDFFNKQLFKYRNLALALRILLASAGGAVTIFSGWQVQDNPPIGLKNGALVAGTLALVLTSIYSFFNPRKLWLEFNQAVVAIDNILLDLNLAKTKIGNGAINDDEMTRIEKGYRDILVRLQDRINFSLAGKEAGET